MSPKPEAVYFTKNLYEASYLLARGFKLSGTKREGNKVVVIFEGENVGTEAMRYYNNEPVGSKILFDSFRCLKDLVFEK